MLSDCTVENNHRDDRSFLDAVTVRVDDLNFSTVTPPQILHSRVCYEAVRSAILATAWLSCF